MRECFVCKTTDKVSFYALVDGSSYVKCSNCQLIFVESIAPQEEIYKAYDGGFFKSTRRKLLAPFRPFSAAKNFKKSINRATRIFDYASSFYQKTTQQPAFLDIGCNKGFLLSVAAERGWDIHGVEIVPELTIPFKNKFKKFASQVHSGGFNDNFHHFQKESFNIITAIDVIEHLVDPVDEMKKIFSLLKPGGTFIIQTPDGDCAEAHETKDNWGALKPLEHLQIYSRKNLEIFSKQLGYTKIKFADPFEDADGNFVASMSK